MDYYQPLDADDMPYVEVHQELKDHPKVKRAIRELGIPKTQLIGHLVCLWWWCLDYAEDGNLSDFNNADIAEAAEWDGDPDTFVSTLLNCGPADRAGFLVDRGDGIEINDWASYGGKYITKRNQGRERQRTLRERNAVVTRDISVTNDNVSISNASREEKRREDEITLDVDVAAAVTAWHQAGQMTTKTIADEIQLAVDDWRELGYAHYVADAITVAAKANKLSWSYVEGILKRCRAQGTAPGGDNRGSKNGSDPVKTEQKTVIYADGSTELQEVQTLGR